MCKQCQGPWSIDRSIQQAGMMGKLPATGKWPSVRSCCLRPAQELAVSESCPPSQAAEVFIVH